LPLVERKTRLESLLHGAPNSSLYAGTESLQTRRWRKADSNSESHPYLRPCFRLRHRCDRGNAQGTESLQTPRWRETDSNSRSR
jgi:hypothetical protein